MRFFFKGKPKQRFIAIFDIGSASVGAALVRIDKKDESSDDISPKIIWTDREILSRHGQTDVSLLSRAVFRSVRTLSERMIKETSRLPEECHCVLSSPWYAAQTRVISFSHPKPMTITENGTANFINRELKRFQQESALFYGIDKKEEIEIIEQKAMKILLNGYTIANPFGALAKEVDIAVYFSVGSMPLFKNIRASIYEGGITAGIYFHSFTFVFFDVMRDLFTESNDFLLCDISGEITDVSFVREDVLKETASFPIGKNTIFRDVIKETKLTIEETTSLFSLLSDNALYITKKEEIALERAAQKWKTEFLLSLEILSGGIPLPRHIFLISNKTILPWLSRYMEKNVKIFTDESRGYSLRKIDVSFLRPLCKVLGAKEDLFLMLEAVFIEKILS